MTSAPDAIVLCGGAGLRLKSVTGNVPKSMSVIDGRPFLEILLKQLRRHDFERVVLAVGYQRDVICSHFGKRWSELDLLYSPESSPLGTGGALRGAIESVRSDIALVMNGDSYTDADLGRFVSEHLKTNADVSMIVVPADGRGDIGSVAVGPKGELSLFEEKKAASASAYMNAGIYLVARRLLALVPLGVPVSLEKELFPRWFKNGVQARAFVHDGACVDIGTPERFETAQALLANAEAGREAFGETPMEKR